MSGAPIFIVGTERSGSNLLRLILNAHSHVHIPHPPHVIRYLHTSTLHEGVAASPAELHRMAREVRELVSAHIHPWEQVPSVGELVEAASPPDLFGLYYALYDLSRARAGKARWGCKSTFMIDHVDRLLRDHPEARFILLVRDPRDVAVSSKASVFSTFHPYETALLWSRQQRVGLDCLARLPAISIHLLRYEDLLAEPEARVRALCTFLDEPYEPAMLRFFETPEARRSSSLSTSWSNTASPILGHNSGRYKQGLSPEELELVESVAGELMERLGYRRELPPSPPPQLSLHARIPIVLQDLALRFEVERGSLLHDKNYRLRWKRALTLLKIGLRRRLTLSTENKFRRDRP